MNPNNINQNSTKSNDLLKEQSGELLTSDNINALVQNDQGSTESNPTVTLPEEMVMYILINKDLLMGKGKIVSQASHAVHYVVHQILEKYINNSNLSDDSMTTFDNSSNQNQHIVNAKEDYAKYCEWTLNGAKTIALNVPANQMMKYVDNNLYKCICIRDSGSLTCIGFYPTNNLKAEMKKYKLL